MAGTGAEMEFRPKAGTVLNQTLLTVRARTGCLLLDTLAATGMG